MSKRKIGIFGLAKELLTAYLSKISSVAYLVKLETQMAKESFIKIIILSVLLAFLLLATWLSILTLLFLFLTMTIHLHFLISIGIVVIINVIACVIVYIYIMHLKKNLNFPATRKQLALTHKNT